MVASLLKSLDPSLVMVLSCVWIYSLDELMGRLNHKWSKLRLVFNRDPSHKKPVLSSSHAKFARKLQK